MLVILYSMIEGHQSCKSNAPFHMKQDANSIEKKNNKSKTRRIRVYVPSSRSSSLLLPLELLLLRLPVVVVVVVAAAVECIWGVCVQVYACVSVRDVEINFV